MKSPIAFYLTAKTVLPSAGQVVVLLAFKLWQHLVHYLGILFTKCKMQKPGFCSYHAFFIRKIYELVYPDSSVVTAPEVPVPEAPWEPLLKLLCPEPDSLLV